MIAFVMMFGVSVFSYIMGNFIEILMGYKSLENTGDSKELSKWIALLTKFNEAHPLSKELITQIEDFFQYYWYNNPLLAFKSDSDIRFISELPDSTVQQIYIDYLFRDFLYQYNHFLRVSVKGRALRVDDPKYRVFLVELVRCLEPRKYYENSSGIIQDQFMEVHEVLFVSQGSILIGYRLFNDTFYAKCIKNTVIVGDFSCLHNKVSEFIYKPHEQVIGFAIKKDKFVQVLDDGLGKKLIPKIVKNYTDLIREPVQKHREITARKFQTRIDYVDLSAFGVGVNFDDVDHFKEGSKKIEEEI